MSKRTRLVLLLIVGPLTAILVLLLLAPLFAGPWVDAFARRKIAELGKERFDSAVSVESVRVSFVPLSATLTGVVFRHKERTDVPPLFRIRQIDITGGPALFADKPRASSVRLHGLEIVVPRRRGPKNEDDRESDSRSSKTQPEANFSAAEIVADGTILRVLSKKPGRDPLVFDLRHLRLHDVSLSEPMRYDAQLTNPRPPGIIRSNGTFGPWYGPDPSLTPLQGDYRFTEADLSDFKGISGILTSEGKFKGVLEEIVVDGTAEVPEFRLNISGNPVHLRTQYHAIVDGTNGDTRLEPVRAQFLKSKVVAVGVVEKEPGRKGKAVRLTVNVSEARIEDMLTLAMRGNRPLLAGPIRFQTKFDLPGDLPGRDEDVVEKLALDGRFNIDDGRFQKNALQDKVDALSRKGQGEPNNNAVDNVTSDLAGAFTLRDGVIRFAHLTFGVRGASVQLDGAYGLRSEEIDFKGQLRLDAKVSETTSGFKALLLKAIDPLFARKSKGKTQSVLPIHISGTRKQPKFGLDVGKALRRAN